MHLNQNKKIKNFENHKKFNFYGKFIIEKNKNIHIFAFLFLMKYIIKQNNLVIWKSGISLLFDNIKGLKNFQIEMQKRISNAKKGII